MAQRWHQVRGGPVCNRTQVISPSLAVSSSHWLGGPGHRLTVQCAVSTDGGDSRALHGSLHVTPRRCVRTGVAGGTEAPVVTGNLCPSSCLDAIVWQTEHMGHRAGPAPRAASARSVWVWGSSYLLPPQLFLTRACDTLRLGKASK